MDDSTEFAHYKVIIPDNYWKVVGEARNQYHDSSNTDPDSGKFAGRTITVDGSWGANPPPWATTTSTYIQNPCSTHTLNNETYYIPNGVMRSKPAPPVPLTLWEKICLFFKLFFTGRS